MRVLLSRDFLTALVLLAVGAVFSADGGAEIKDWIFPLLATYVVFGIAVALLGLVAFRAVTGRLKDVIQLTPEDRVAYFDVLVFFLVVLAYVFVLYGLGFWLASLLMLSLTSVYLTLDKTRTNLALAVVVPLAACIAAYFIFTHVFYVPFPEATWWRGLGLG
ncbi:MAG: tripartite tricarboxylate transporter TctB family protein [Rhodospirillales bacterium]|nr:MAG: tripartite tricarboxylate transporter TctB family protein [Rhodospirillales bacterium]